MLKSYRFLAIDGKSAAETWQGAFYPASTADQAIRMITTPDTFFLDTCHDAISNS
jgi:hypothetical protein